MALERWWMARRSNQLSLYTVLSLGAATTTLSSVVTLITTTERRRFLLGGLCWPNSIPCGLPLPGRLRSPLWWWIVALIMCVQKCASLWVYIHIFQGRRLREETKKQKGLKSIFGSDVRRIIDLLLRREKKGTFLRCEAHWILLKILKVWEV